MRLRLTQPDLVALAESGRVVAVVPFPAGARLQYVLEATGTTDRLTASYEDHAVVVRLPKAWLSEWVETDRVGFEATLPLERDNTLHLLVEKDFECLHKPSSSSEAFPHPHAASDES